MSLSLFLSPLTPSLPPLSLLQSLLHTYTLMYLSCELLQPSNVNRPLLRCIQVARSDTKVRGRTDHSTGESERVVGEDSLRSSIVVLKFMTVNLGCHNSTHMSWHLINMQLLWYCVIHVHAQGRGTSTYASLLVRNYVCESVCTINIINFCYLLPYSQCR